jgi:hypothetical protein
MKKLLITVALIALAVSAMAQDVMKVVTPDELVWKEHPVFKGAQTVILVGDPTKAETIVQRVSFHPISKFRRTLILIRKSSRCLGLVMK